MKGTAGPTLDAPTGHGPAGGRPRSGRRWWVWVAAGLGLVTLALAATAGVLAWRAAGTPAWYDTARAVPSDSPEADAAINRHLIPVQNWMARTTAGPLAADERPDALRETTLTLTETQINALLAKGLDNVPGPLKNYRVRLTAGRVDLACTVADWGRVVGTSVAVDADENGPAVRSGGVTLGNQAVPLAWALSWAPGDPSAKLRAQLADPARRGKPPTINEHDLAPRRTADVYYGRLLLDALAGKSVRPLAFLPGARNGDELVATKITRLDVADGRVTVTFRLLDAGERAATVAALNAPARP